MPKIPNNPEEIFQEFVAEYQQVFGSDLVSIILYGSAARGEYIPKKSDINFLIILTEDGINSLSRTFKIVTRWYKRRVSTPLFLTRSYIHSSLDVFPIEFLNMKAFHQVVFGEDVLKDLIVDRKFLRLQCERELKGKLLQLRHHFLETGGNKADIEKLIARSLPAFHSIFHAVAFFKQESLPRGRHELLSLIAHETGINSALFLDMLKIKEGTKRLSSGEALLFMENYIEQIKKLSSFVDEMKIEEVKTHEHY